MATQAERTDATTGDLLDAARDLFGSKGFAQTSTTEIVKAAAVTRGALYHHFATKVDVFEAVFAREQEVLARAVVKAAARESDPAEQVRAGCRVFLDACLRPDFQRIALVDGPAVLGAERVREIESRHTFRLLMSSLRAVRPGAAAGDLEVRAWMLFGALCEAGLYLGRASRPRVAQRQVLSQLDGILTGLFSVDA